MFEEFKDKVVVVTGGSRGIGKAIVLKFASLGAKVVFNYASNDEAAQKVVEEAKEFSGEVECFKLDVSNFSKVCEFFEQIFDKYGAIHVLINNAGITRDTLLARMKEEEWDAVINVNLKGVFNCCKAIISNMMRQRWGRIINIGSVIGSMGNAGQVNYAATKAGVVGFSRSLAKEVALRNITVNVIAPGFIETDMTAKVPEKIKKQILQAIPMNRFGSAEDIANAATFLASEGASYITGAVLHINGGLYMG